MADPSAADAPTPVEGQEYTDGISQGFTWLVSWVENGMVWLTGCEGGKVTEAYLRWPLNRWPALIEKQRLTLVED